MVEAEAEAEAEAEIGVTITAVVEVLLEDREEDKHESVLHRTFWNLVLL